MINIDGRPVRVIDSHTHIWNEYKGMRLGYIQEENLGYGKIRHEGKVEKLLPPSFIDNQVPAEVLIGYMDDAGIDQSFILQNPCYGDQRAYVKSTLEKYPERFIGACGKIDPRDVDALPAEMDSLVSQYGCCGYKIEVPDVPFWMDDDEHDFMWKKIADEDRLVVIDLGWGTTPYDFNIDRLENVLRKYPNIRMWVPHLGVSRLWDAEQKYPYPELQKFLKLFKLNKNLYTDNSAMPAYIEEQYPEPRNVEIFKTVYETIGSERILWGTDFPTLLKYRTMEQMLSFATSCCDFLTFEDKENILSKNILRLLRK